MSLKDWLHHDLALNEKVTMYSGRHEKWSMGGKFDICEKNIHH